MANTVDADTLAETDSTAAETGSTAAQSNAHAEESRPADEGTASVVSPHRSL